MVHPLLPAASTPLEDALVTVGEGILNRRAQEQQVLLGMGAMGTWSDRPILMRLFLASLGVYDLPEQLLLPPANPPSYRGIDIVSETRRIYAALVAYRGTWAGVQGTLKEVLPTELLYRDERRLQFELRSGLLRGIDSYLWAMKYHSTVHAPLYRIWNSNNNRSAMIWGQPRVAGSGCWGVGLWGVDSGVVVDGVLISLALWLRHAAAVRRRPPATATIRRVSIQTHDFRVDMTYRRGNRLLGPPWTTWQRLGSWLPDGGSRSTTAPIVPS